MLGKLFLTLDAIGLLMGAPLADYNETHIFNPRWPPHAKFHGAQTISLSLALGLATLYFTYRPLFFSSGQDQESLAAKRLRKRDSLRTALFTGTIYWMTGLVSILYPGTDGVDPEFGTPGTFPQAPIFASFMLFGILGWFLEN
ncbi:hypothetical protein QBC37DRAFT_158182 [Rhypophila decipiens]|uniref:Uncharacterized protein n=1 Tax=Rhypophila decipiens TaxID=261697 RepID=A0AAN6Y940_9PEZI|nr:hypothetical protein QBC37DRAFT_158182 [Rhypophila decipiens]